MLLPNLCSNIFLTSLGMYLLCSKHFTNHPYHLFGWVCILDAMISSRVINGVVYYGLRCPGYAYSFIRLGSLFPNLECSPFLLHMLNLSLTLQVLIGEASVGLNMLSFIDLYLTLTNPFKPRNSRNKYYIIIMIIYTSILIAVGYTDLKEGYFVTINQ